MKRKVLLFLLSFFALVFVASCTSNNSDNKKENITVSEKYTVEFVFNNGSESEIVTVEKGQKVEAPENPFKPSDEQYTYFFEGWYTSIFYLTEFDFDKPINGNTKVYAKWDKEERQYTATFIFNNGTPVMTQTLSYGDTVSKPTDPVKESDSDYRYTFAGWFSDTDPYNPYNFSNQIKGDVTLTAKWTSVENNYTVTFDGTNSSQVIKCGECASRPSQNPSKPSDVEFDYIFDDWYIDASHNTKYNFDTPVTEDITLYPNWNKTVRKYSVIFDSNGGSHVDSIDVDYNTTATEPTAPKRDGYNFDGWYYGDKKWDFSSDKVTKDIELVAKWDEKVLSVKYILRDIDGVISTYTKNNVHATAGFYVYDPELEDGYTRTKWYDSTGKIYLNGDVLNVDSLLEVYSDVYTEGLLFKEESNSYSVSNYNGTEPIVRVPQYYYGLPVTKIGANAFKNNTKLVGIYMSDKITDMGSDAFAGTTSLAIVELSPNLKYLPDYAFQYSGIRYFDCPYVTSIGIYAFYGCQSLISLNKDSDNVVNFKEIPMNAFSGCTSLTSFNFKNVKEIGSSAFHNSSIETLYNIGDIVIIGEYAFSGCTSLTSFTAPVNCKVIESYAFYGCTNLSSFYLSDSVLYVGYSILYDTAVTFTNKSNCQYIGTTTNNYYCLYKASNTSTLTIRDDCYVIGSSACQSLSSLTTVTIHSDVKSICRQAFAGCKNLKTVNISAYGELKLIGDVAFGGTAIESFVIPMEVKFIGKQVFNGCDNLTNIESPINGFYYNYCLTDEINWDPITLGYLVYSDWDNFITVKDNVQALIQIMKAPYRLAYNSSVYMHNEF